MTKEQLESDCFIFHVRLIFDIFKTSQVFFCPPCKSPKRTTWWGRVKCDQKNTWLNFKVMFVETFLTAVLLTLKAAKTLITTSKEPARGYYCLS